MHSIDIAHFPPRAGWSAFAPHEPAHASPLSAVESNRHDSDAAGIGTGSRDSDFLRQVLSARVMTALHADYRMGEVVPVPGLTPAESAGQALAGAARQALAPGGQGADSLRTLVGSGLQDAASWLRGLGAAVEDVAALAQEVRSRLESFIGLAAAAQAGSVAQETVVAVGVRFTQTQKEKLEIVTQEGDTVRLSLRSRVEVSAGGVASTASDGAIGTTKNLAVAVTLVSGSKFQISVDGHLNDDELAAIREVLIKVEALAEDFFQGNVQAAFAAAAQLDIDAEQLASVALDLSLKQRLRVSGFVQSAAAPSLVAPAPIAPWTALPVLDRTASEPPPGAVAAAAVSVPADAGAAPVSAPQPDSAVSPGLTISGYLRQVLDALREAGSTGQASGSWKFKIELLYATVAADAAHPSARASAAAVNKLGEALTFLA